MNVYTDVPDWLSILFVRGLCVNVACSFTSLTRMNFSTIHQQQSPVWMTSDTSMFRPAASLATTVGLRIIHSLDSGLSVLKCISQSLSSVQVRCNHTRVVVNKK